MPQHQVVVECPVPGGFAVDTVRGMFDLKPEKTARQQFDVELPADDEDWKLGVIVGPSGSGKTTVARHAYGKRFTEGGFRWEKQKAVVDHFGKLSMKVVTATLTSVGFSSPPSWPSMNSPAWWIAPSRGSARRRWPRRFARAGSRRSSSQ